MSSNHAFHGRPPIGATAPQIIRLTVALVAALLAGLAVTGVFSSAVGGLFSSDDGASTSAVSIPYAPRQLVISSAKPLDQLIAYIRLHTGIEARRSGESTDAPGEQVLELPANVSVPKVASALRALPGVRYAVPNYIAKAAGNFIPNDPGSSGKAHGWQQLQWNFSAADGVDAPQAWGNLISDHRAGAKGVVVAVLDSGVAYRNWGTFKRSPDFNGTKFVSPCDLIGGTIKAGVCTDRFPLDRLGHGTFVAGTIAEATNNHYGLTGLAYHASIMPVRVLDANGAGTSNTIAEGVRYAVAHGAQVINLSIEFPPGTNAPEIPELISAIDFAHARGVVVVASAGNDYNTSVDFPAAAPDVISVGATTKDRCLAAYSDTGKVLDLVAPGGGDDSGTVHTANCHPTRNLPDIYQMTFSDQATAANTSVNVDAFALQSGWFGTSMAAPDVSGAAAMVIASGVLGAHPSPDAILARLEATAAHLSGATPNDKYGYGLVDVGAATSKGGPPARTTPVSTTPAKTTPTTTCTTTSTTTTPTATATTPTGTATTSTKAAKTTTTGTQTSTASTAAACTTTTITPAVTTTTPTTTTTTSSTTTS